jgi:hypothetical protein
MRSVAPVVLVGVGALAAAGAAPAVTPPMIVMPLVGTAVDAVDFQSPDHKATVQLSTVKAGAGRVALTVRLQGLLRCGRPTGGAVVVTLPRAAQLPHAIAVGSVRVNGKAPSKVSVSGRSVTVGLPVVHGITCNSLTDGTVQVAFAPAAALRNPAVAGTYAVSVRQGRSAHTVQVAIRG